MSLRIKMDSFGEVEDITLVLAKKDGEKIGVIPVYDIVFKDKLNAASELSFKISKYEDDEMVNCWDSIVDFRLVWCKEYDLWFEIYVEIDEDDENGTVKKVSAKTICEAELSQINLYNIEINTEDDIAREDYENPTVFYNKNDPECSLLDRIKEKAPHYKIESVDDSLVDIQRQFSFDEESLYDALQDIAEEIGCIFIFNSGSNTDGKPAREITVKDLWSTCGNCRKRSEFTDSCPYCNSTDLEKSAYGDDTGIFADIDTLTDDISYSTDTDSVKNCFKLEAGDDLMTATVKACNPNGSDYIWHITTEMRRDMPSELNKKINNYDSEYSTWRTTDIDLGESVDTTSYKGVGENTISDSDIDDYNTLIGKYDEYREADEKFTELAYTVTGFQGIISAYYDTVDLKLFLESGLMPSPTTDKSVEGIVADIEEAFGSSLTIALASTESISETVAENAIVGYAELSSTSACKVEIETSALKETSWKGTLKVTSLYTKTNNVTYDTATTDELTVTFSDDKTIYTTQRIEKILNAKDKLNYGIAGLFDTEGIVNGTATISDFKTNIENYSLNCLNDFYDACQAVLDVLTDYEQQKETDTNGDVTYDPYSTFYTPFWNRFQSLESEIETREDEIETVEDMQDKLESIRNYVQDKLDFQEYLGTDLWKIFCSFRREDKYKNTNYISDDLSNAELLENANDFLGAAAIELYKSSEAQHTISGSLKNFLAMEEFKGLTDKFEVGNWMHLGVDGKVYKLRLIEYEIDYSDLRNIAVEFSDITDVKDSFADIESVLKQAKNMSTSYDSVTRQAKNGNDANNRVSGWVNDGLALTNTFISNSDNQEIITDSHGILIKEYDPLNDNYSSKQVKIINKGLYFTNDAWKTAKVGVGAFKYKDPADSFKEKEAYGVIADTLVGNLILGEKVGIYNDNGSIVLDKDGLKMKSADTDTGTDYSTTISKTGMVMKYNNNSFNVNLKSDSDFLTVKNGDTKLFVVDEYGNATFSGDLNAAGGTFSGDLNAAGGTFSGDLKIGEYTKEDDNGKESTAYHFIVDGSTGDVTSTGNITLKGDTKIYAGNYYDSDGKGVLSLGNSEYTSGNYLVDLTYTRTKDNKVLFQIYTNDGSSASLYLYGASIGYSGGNGFYPTLGWDFQYATVSNLKVCFS